MDILIRFLLLALLAVVLREPRTQPDPRHERPLPTLHDPVELGEI